MSMKEQREALVPGKVLEQHKVLRRFRTYHWVSLTTVTYEMRIGYVCSLNNDKSQVVHSYLFWQLWSNEEHACCRNVLEVPSVSMYMSYSIIWIIPKSLKFVNAFKFFQNLFQYWNLTKNDQKLLKIKLGAHKWGGCFCGRRRRRRDFLATPQTCLNAGFAGPLRLRPADAVR